MLSEIYNEVDKLRWVYQTAEDNHKQAKSNVNSLSLELSKLEKASELCLLCIQDSIDAKDYIENLVSLLLQHVFDEDVLFQFNIITDKTSEQITGLRPVIIRNNVVEDADGSPDGYKNVAAFGLRLAFLLLNSDLEQVLIMDEPLTNLAVDKWERLVDFLKEYSENLDFQLIVITHINTEFPRTIQVKMNHGISKGEVITGIMNE